MAIEIPIDVTVEDSGIDKLTSDLNGLKDKIRASTREIEDFKESISKMKGLGIPTEEIDKAKTKLAEMESSLKGVKRAAEDKGLHLQGLQQGTKGGTEGLKGLLGLGQAAGGKLGEFSGKGSQLVEVLGKIGQGGEAAGGALGKLAQQAAQNGGKIGIIIAAVLVLAAVLTAGVRAMIDFAKHAIKASDAARTLAITAVATFGDKSGAQAWAKEVEDLHDRTDLTREKLQEMGLTLKKFKGDEYTSAFNAIAVATSAIGDEGGKAIEGLINKIKDGAETAKSTKFQFKADDFKDLPISVEQLANSLAKIKGTSAASALKDIKNNTVEVSEALLAVRAATDEAYGEAALQKGKSFESLSKKLGENWDSLFEGADLRVIIVAFEKLVNLFDTSNTSGKELKGVFGAIADVLINIGAGAILWIVAAIENAIIVVNKLYIAWLDVQLAILDVEDAIDSALSAAASGIKDVAKALQGWYQMGADAVSGLATGIADNIQKAIDAILNVGDKIKAAFRKALGIASPSKVFMEYGGFIAEGAAEGMEDGTPDVEKASADMLPVAEIGKDIQNNSVMNKTSSSSSPNIVINIEGTNAPDIANEVFITLKELLFNSAQSGGIDTATI